MHRFLKRICLCLAAVLLLPLCFPAHADGNTTLFVNDAAWESDPLLPFIESGGMQLLPASAFGAMDGVSVTGSTALGSLLLVRGDRYLSYNLNFGTCLDETGNVTNVGIYRYADEVYLAPEPICAKFGLRFETAYGADGYLAARLSDGSETRSFAELLAENTESETAKEERIHLTAPSAPTVSGVFLHPILLVPAAANVKTIINLLGTHTATFAIAPDDVAEYTALFPAIFAAGHGVAYYMDPNCKSQTEIDAFADAMREANEYLFSITGKVTRVFVSTELANNLPEIAGYAGKSCRLNLVVDDLRSERMVNLTLSESPNFGVFNFSLATDRDTRSYYTEFFRRFDEYADLRAMPLTESCPIQ